ncbi:MAG: isocitrate dehydrogenase (NADP(+)) [Anaerolineaceae bacterium]|nr:isocitrate dehydrogenase (NADP(+)) [Anaerolineaceae bacterium]
MQKIKCENNQLFVPDQPTIPFIPGDGIGPEVWEATQAIVDAAVQKAYHGQKAITWMEIAAGEKSAQNSGEWLPQATLDTIREYIVAIKGPLTTPVGGGIRSLNVTLRKTLDLFVCLRPIRWFEGVAAPVREPQLIDLIIFRENTEDLYAGIEYAAGTPENQIMLDFFKEKFPKDFAKIRFPENVGLGVKPISKQGSERLVRAAINYAIKNHRKTVTLVHKGNIMKFTEGAFRNWGYDLAESEFSSMVFTKRQWETIKKEEGEAVADEYKKEALRNNKIWINDVITDAAFQQVLLYPADFDVIASTNLNGDYLSDAIAAQVGGIGIAPGANINMDTQVAIFEATHGTAPAIAGKDIANPSSLLLSAEMMLIYIGWTEAAEMILSALKKTIKQKFLTADLALYVPNAELMGTKAFTEKIIKNMD